jgi:hypothetical protein
MSKKKLLLSHLIKDFVKTKSRAPSQRELDYMYNKHLIDHPDFEETGLNGSEEQRFNQSVNKESSAKNFNEVVSRFISEQKFISNELEKIDEKTENEFRLYANKFNESLKHIKTLERNINKNLLLHSKDDIYTHGFVENFQDYKNIDFNKSNIYMLNGKVTLGYTKIAGENFQSKNLSYSLASREGRSLGQRNINDISNAVNEDGSFFKVLGFSKVPNDSIDFIVSIDFDEPKEIDTIKFTVQAIESNSKIFYSCYYNDSSSQYKEVFESSLAIDNNENFVEINKKNVNSIKLVFNKNGYDYKDGEDYVYIFDLDFLGGTTKAFKINEESILNLGPYKILDEEGNEVNFSMATIKGGTCCIVPEKTSVDFYLSKDNLNWIKADYNDTSKKVIQFEEGEETFDGNGVFKKFTFGENNALSNIIEDTSKIDLKPLAHQKYLSLYVEKEKFNEIVKKSLIIKRNVCNKKNKTTYSAKEGWYLNENKYYCCIINIEEPEGRYLDFGERSCFINEKQVSGKHFLSYGSHKFKTSEENWFDLDEDQEGLFQTELQLREEDILYPYNHKYIVEGFEYSDFFAGEKVYLAKNDVYSYELKEVSNQRFLIDKDLSKFTFINSNFTNDAGVLEEAVFIAVNAKEESSEAKIEDYKFKCRKKNPINETSSNNELYVKAVLKSSDSSVTPKIDQIQVRVI